MTEKLQHWIEHPEHLNKETLYELRTLLARYPYFATARLLYLKNLYLLHDASFGDELRKAAVWIPDRKKLFTLIEGEKQSQTRQSNRIRVEQADDNGCLDRTLQLIDDFLATVPEEQQTDVDEGSLQADYITYMLHEEGTPASEAPEMEKPMRGQSLIDSFLEKSANGFPKLGLPADEEGQSANKEGTRPAKKATLITFHQNPTDENSEESVGTPPKEEEKPAWNVASAPLEDDEDEPDDELDEPTEEEHSKTTRPSLDKMPEPLDDEDELDDEDSADEAFAEPDDEGPSVATPTDDEDDGFFTETLARIYIKQQRYEKALEIIKKLSLKYPKKNTYFADQIRFLKKLIINTKSK